MLFFFCLFKSKLKKKKKKIVQLFEFINSKCLINKIKIKYYFNPLFSI